MIHKFENIFKDPKICGFYGYALLMFPITLHKDVRWYQIIGNRVLTGNTKIAFSIMSIQ